MELDRLKGSERDFRYAPSWFGKCEQAVQWLRKDGLPRLVHRSVLKELLAAVNEELAQFQASFRVAVNDDVSFTAIFGSGKQIPSKALSGGEKYILGISFLIAVNRTFAGNLGIMFLDEPTASLDAFHLRLLLRSLQQWKTILHRRQRQLIIVTHVEEMAAIADAVIRFGDEGELLSSPNIAA